MKHVFKSIKNALISICYLFQWILLRLLNVNFTKCRKKKENFRTIKILGNGPSLNKILDNVEDGKMFDYCCVNFSPLSESFFRIKPKYLVIVDPAFFNRNDEQIQKCFKNILAVDWEITLVVPYYVKKQVQKSFMKNKNIKYILFPGGLELKMNIKRLRFYLLKHGLAGPPPQNVMVAAIYHMIMEGYNTIELFGVEHSWLHQIVVNEKSQLCLIDSHFYDKEKPIMKPWMLHGRQLLLHELLEMLSITFGAYHDLKYFADRLGGINIYNSVPDSFIDAFVKKL